jgi:hypothetical protein
MCRRAAHFVAILHHQISGGDFRFGRCFRIAAKKCLESSERQQERHAHLSVKHGVALAHAWATSRRNLTEGGRSWRLQNYLQLPELKIPECLQLIEKIGAPGRN